MTERYVGPSFGGQRRFWPLGPWPLVLLGIAIIGSIAMSAYAPFDWPFVTWTAVNDLLMQQLAFSAPVAAAFATFYAGRMAPKNRLFAARPQSRQPGQIINRELAQVVVVGASAAWIGLAPLLFLGARESTNGTLDPLVALTVLVCLSSAILFGYMLGLLGRSALWAPVSFAAVFFYLALAGTESYVGAVVLPFDLVPGRVITTRSVVYRFVIYCLIGLAAWHGARYLRATAKARPPVTLIVLALLAVGAAVAPIWRPIPLVAYETSPPKTCRTVHGILYCVHQENRAQLTPIIQASQTVLARYSPTRPPQLTAIYDTGLRGTVPQDPDTTFWTAIAPPPMQAPSESAATDLAFALTTTEACENGQNSSSAAQAQRFVTSWLSAGVDGQTATPDYDGGGSPLPELFGTMTKSQIHNWFAKNGERLRNCRVNAEDLPR